MLPSISKRSAYNDDFSDIEVLFVNLIAAIEVRDKPMSAIIVPLTTRFLSFIAYVVSELGGLHDLTPCHAIS